MTAPIVGAISLVLLVLVIALTSRVMRRQRRAGRVSTEALRRGLGRRR